MSWVLLFWLNTNTSYQYHIHSEYSSLQECQAKEEYYGKIFKTVYSKLISSCKTTDFTKKLKPSKKLAYRKEVVY